MPVFSASSVRRAFFSKDGSSSRCSPSASSKLEAERVKLLPFNAGDSFRFRSAAHRKRQLPMGVEQRVVEDSPFCVPAICNSDDAKEPKTKRLKKISPESSPRSSAGELESPAGPRPVSEKLEGSSTCLFSDAEDEEKEAPCDPPPRSTNGTASTATSSPPSFCTRDKPTRQIQEPSDSSSEEEDVSAAEAASSDDSEEEDSANAPVAAGRKNAAPKRRLVVASEAGPRKASVSQGKEKANGSGSVGPEPKTGSLFACRVSSPSVDVTSPCFDPALAVAEKDCMNKQGEVLFAWLAKALDLVETLKGSGSGSNKKQALVLTNMLRLLVYASPKDLTSAIYFCLNKVAADFLNVEVGVGDAIILKAMAETYGASEQNLKKEQQRCEDLGILAERMSSRVRTLVAPQPLTLQTVFSLLKQIAAAGGRDAQTRKRGMIRRLLVAARNHEPKFIIRFLQQRLRVGCASASVYQALAFAFCLTHNARGGFPAIGDVRSYKGEARALQASDLPPEAAQKERALFVDTKDGESGDEALIREKTPMQLEAALSQMEASVRRALCEQPSVELLLEQLLRGASYASLNELCICRPGLPLLPMLARPSRGFSEVFERLGDATFTCEYKYDGERIQIHVMSRRQLRDLQEMLKKPSSSEGSFVSRPAPSQGMQKGPRGESVSSSSSTQATLPFAKGVLAAPKIQGSAQTLQFAKESQSTGSAAGCDEGSDADLVVRLYSRSLEDITERFPDVCKLVLAELLPEVKDCIIDAEVVAFDLTNRTLLPFQTLSTRKRKQVSLDEIQVHVALYCFDCMRFNGVSALSEPLGRRRELLKKAVSLNPEGRVLEARHKELTGQEEFEDFLFEAVANGCEGLMVKSLDPCSSYEPSKRSNSWLKVKKDYLQGLTDSVDLVPIGAFYGKGKRSGVYGAYLLAVYCPTSECFQTVCKAGTGFSDSMLQRHYEALKEKVISSKKPYYDCDMEPDVWLEASEVWECAAADLSYSPVHTAARHETAEGREVSLAAPSTLQGIGLRFPRFLRVREDKTPEQATTPQQIWQMFNSQFGQSEEELKKKRGVCAKNGVANPSDSSKVSESHSAESSLLPSVSAETRKEEGSSSGVEKGASLPQDE